MAGTYRGHVAAPARLVRDQQFGRPIAAAGRFCEVEPVEPDPPVVLLLLPAPLAIPVLVVEPVPAVLPPMVEPLVPVLLPVLVVVMSRIWLVALSQHLP